jgi:hypothetical protein
MPVSKEYENGFRQGFIEGAKREREAEIERLRSKAQPIIGNKQGEGREWNLTPSEFARDSHSHMLEVLPLPKCPDKL